jgi:glyoxylase-like metal-dependent hydrolase (beta-lactamase superfamily II)
MKPLSIGAVGVSTVVESLRVPMSFAEFLPEAAAAPEVLEAARPWLEPRFADLGVDPRAGSGFLDFHTYVVRTPRHVILVDTCIGDDKERGGHRFFHKLKTPWLANLRAAGLAPEQVDFVMCTHMHADHVGWNTRLADGRWVPTFPNAKYLFARTEFEHRRRNFEAAQGAGYGAYADSILPVVETGQALIVDDGHELDGHLWIEPAPGHTPGNVVIQLASRGERGVFCGDVLHHPIQVAHPEWSAAFCEDRVQSAATRRRFVAAHADTGTIVMPAHFPAPTAGRIRSHGERWRYDFLD